MITWPIVEAEMTRPFAWGVTDCGTAACNILALTHGVDPAAPIRGRYSDVRGAQQVISGFGGFERMVAFLMTQADLMEDPHTPLIGFVSRAHPDGVGVAIRLPDGIWVGKTQSGYITGVSPSRVWGL